MMAAMRVMRALGFAAIVALVSLGAWVGWGLVGWAVVMVAFAGWLFWKAATVTRIRRKTDDAWEPLVAVSNFAEPFEAELMCQALEDEGIRCTYYGRAIPGGVTPGGA